jgi:hypothetical protein
LGVVFDFLENITATINVAVFPKEFNFLVYTMQSFSSNSSGCDISFTTPDYMWYWIRFEYGEQIYDDIQFVGTDRTEIYEKTYVRETCSNLDGCNAEDVTYIINDDQGNLLYEFSQGIWISYGSKAPYLATLTLDDVNVIYQKTGSDVAQYCEETSCTENVSVFFEATNGEQEYMVYTPMRYSQGDQLINDFIVDATLATPFETSLNRLCGSVDGCYYSTVIFVNNIII